MTTNPRFLDYEGRIYIRVERPGQLPAYSGHAVKVGALGEEPKPIKMKLDLDVNEALEKIGSVISRTQLADAMVGQPFIVNAQNFSIAQAEITNTIQSDKFEDGVQGWSLNAETGTVKIFGPHRN